MEGGGGERRNEGHRRAGGGERPAGRSAVLVTASPGGSARTQPPWAPTPPGFSQECL